jgi:hypothetical protein
MRRGPRATRHREGRLQRRRWHSWHELTPQIGDWPKGSSWTTLPASSDELKHERPQSHHLNAAPHQCKHEGWLSPHSEGFIIEASLRVLDRQRYASLAINTASNLRGAARSRVARCVVGASCSRWGRA